MFKKFASLAQAGVSASVEALGLIPKNSGKIYGYGPIKRMLQQHGRSTRGSFFHPKTNRNTGNAHEHRREIARATTRPGSPERRAAYEAARAPSR